MRSLLLFLLSQGGGGGGAASGGNTDSVRSINALKVTQSSMNSEGPRVDEHARN